MAIAFDAATSGGTTTGTSLTFAHTTSGSNRILFVGTQGKVNADSITGVTYGGTAMTKVNTILGNVNDRYQTLWMLVAPASGANNVVVTSNVSDFILGTASSYTGALQSGQPDANITNSNDTIASGASHTITLTTVADNSWTVIFDAISAGPVSAGAGTTARASPADVLMGDSNAAITPAGSTSLAMVNNNASTRRCAGVMASFSPAAATTVYPRLTMMGVGQ